MYERDHVFPDIILDKWAPIEKAAYPHYFEKREKAKIDMVQMWEAAQKKDPKSDKKDEKKH